MTTLSERVLIRGQKVRIMNVCEIDHMCDKIIPIIVF